MALRHLMARSSTLLSPEPALTSPASYVLSYTASPPDAKSSLQGATQVVAGKTVCTKSSQVADRRAHFPSSSQVHDPESACMEVIYSGGGFSNYFGLPSYQKSAVQGYLKNHKPSYPANIWNATGTSRAIPDISANGCALFSSLIAKRLS